MGILPKKTLTGIGKSHKTTNFGLLTDILFMAAGHKSRPAASGIATDAAVGLFLLVDHDAVDAAFHVVLRVDAAQRDGVVAVLEVKVAVDFVGTTVLRGRHLDGLHHLAVERHFNQTHIVLVVGSEFATHHHAVAVEAYGAHTVDGLVAQSALAHSLHALKRLLQTHGLHPLGLYLHRLGGRFAPVEGYHL